MNIVNRLTIRQLKLNKKRTLVTIIGTIISAAMITAVVSLGLSFSSLMQRQSIANNGEWHVKYEKINRVQYQQIKSDSDTKTTVLTRDLGYAKITGSKNLNKPYLFIKELSKIGFEKFPVKLIKGRWPEKPNEIVIADTIRSNAKVNLNIGDRINLSIGQRYSKENKKDNVPLEQNYCLEWKDNKLNEVLTNERTKTYKIVGIIKSNVWEYTWSPGYTALSYIDTDTITNTDTFDTYVIVKHINNKLFDHAQKLSSRLNIKNCSFNNDLLRYYGVVKDDIVKRMLEIFSAIIIIIIMIGSISLIYNAFAISVSERSRYLGMLSSVGATRRQKRNSVFFEGAIIGAISIPIGIASGYLGLWITFLCINPMIKGALRVTESFELRFYPSVFLITILVSAGTILLSTYIPAKKASRISAIDAIRQSNEIKLSQKQVRTSGIIRKIFGMEGELGLKNLKRNRSRYRATVLSIVISMVLFLVVSSFTDTLKKAVIMSQDGINFDIQATVNSEDEKERAEIIDSIASSDDIREKSKINTLTASIWIKTDAIADYLKKNNNMSVVKNGKYPYFISLDVMDDDSLKDYAKKVGVDFNRLTDTENPSAIIIDQVKFKDKNKDKYVETRVIKADIGDKLEMSIPDTLKNKQEKIKPVEIAALTNIMPMGIMPLGECAGFHAIISNKVFKEIIKEREKDANKVINSCVFLNSDHPLKLQDSIEKIQSLVGESKLTVFNVYNYKQREQQMITLLSVFSYAFILLITLICIANIINTVSTSIALRKREFAMLKSVGITPKAFNKMLYFESIFYGIKALIYGIPISIAAMYLMYLSLQAKFNYAFTVSIINIIISITSVFLIVGTAMLYSSIKVRKENIIDALKQEII